jgi:hypothetical protein
VQLALATQVVDPVAQIIERHCGESVCQEVARGSEARRDRRWTVDD